MENKNMKLGIAGCGWIAEKAHIPAFQQIDGLVIYSVFDLVEDKAVSLSSKYNIPKTYNNYDEFLASGIDAVIIATPNFTHAEYSVKALGKGIHVLCEKPVAISVEEIQKVKSEAKKSGCYYMPGFVNRFRYDISKIRECILNKEIGEIVSVNCGWLRRSGIPRPGTWFTNKKNSGGGVLIDLGSHMIDISTMFLGNASLTEVALQTHYSKQEAMKASAGWFTSNVKADFCIDVEDTAICDFTYENGISAKIMLSWSAPIQGDCTYFKLNGTEGSMELHTLFGFSNDRLFQKDKLMIKRKNGVDYTLDLDRDRNNTELAFLSMARYFIEVIRKGEKAVITCQDAINNVELIEKLYMKEDTEGINLMNMRWGYEIE